MRQFLYFFRPQLKLVHSAESVFIYYICLVFLNLLYLFVIYETIFSNFILYFGQWGGVELNLLGPTLEGKLKCSIPGRLIKLKRYKV